MIDAGNGYAREGAYVLAKVLEELDFYRFEAPVSDTDIEGLTELARKYTMDISPVAALREAFNTNYDPHG